MNHLSSDAEPDRGAAPKSAMGSKQPPRKIQLVRLLSRKSGADLAAICKRFSWQPHTARAALSGLRKAGIDVEKESSVAGKPMRYRIKAVGENTAAVDVPNGK